MIYDAFEHLPIYGLEDLGFVLRGETGTFIAASATRPPASPGRLPGLAARGSRSPPMAATFTYMHSGMYSMDALQESVRQMRSTAPAHIPDANISVYHGVGGMFADSGTIIMSNEPP
jgi:hypothetical protein